MDFYTYWNNWRQAYHEGRAVYHQAMSRFYSNQKEAMELWPKMMLEAYKAWIGLSALRNLTKPTDFFGKWT